MGNGTLSLYLWKTVGLKNISECMGSHLQKRHIDIIPCLKFLLFRGLPCDVEAKWKPRKEISVVDVPLHVSLSKDLDGIKLPIISAYEITEQDGFANFHKMLQIIHMRHLKKDKCMLPAHESCAVTHIEG